MRVYDLLLLAICRLAKPRVIVNQLYVGGVKALNTREHDTLTLLH